MKDQTESVRDRSFSDLKIGETASFDVHISEEMMRAFGQMTGDVNPLHTDESYASSTKFGRRVVYGQLLNALFSRLIGHYLPGRRALYLSQTSRFDAPCFVGDRIRVLGRLTEKHERSGLLTIETSIHRLPSDDLLVSGTAVAMVMEPIRA